jgi:DNA polymerase-4
MAARSAARSARAQCLLAKTAADMRKPDGLTVIEQADLPQALHGLELTDLCGIGPSMESRLHQAGIHTVERLLPRRRAAARHLGRHRG